MNLLVEPIEITSLHDLYGEYGVTLMSLSSQKKLEIIVGAHEAQMLAIEIEEMKAVRPLPQDLLYDAITQMGYDMYHAIIYELKDDIFMSKIVCKAGDKTVILEARTADALVMSLKFKRYTYVSIHLLQ